MIKLCPNEQKNQVLPKKAGSGFAKTVSLFVNNKSIGFGFARGVHVWSQCCIHECPSKKT